MSSRRAPRRGETGIVLMELAVSLPLFVLLLSFLAFALAWSWRSYQCEVADAELRQELRIAFSRVVEDALVSDRIRKHWQGGYELRAHAGQNTAVQYWINDGKLVRRAASSPITGAFAGANVHITEFTIEPAENKVPLYHIRMTGISAATDRTYSLSTKIYLRGSSGGI